MAKQPTLKPQDLVVALKLGTNSDRSFTFAGLAKELHMSVSEAHASVRRAQLSRLIVTDSGEMQADRMSLEEFVLRGVRYVFPAVMGPVARGVPTAGAGPVLTKYYANSNEGSFVWPHPSGQTRGIALQPLYPTVPLAALEDLKLYEALTLVDAVRAGTARDRELAEVEFRKRLL